MTEWIEELTTIALRWRAGPLSIRDLFHASSPPEGLTADAFRTALLEQLSRHPELVEAWQSYSYDKRGTPSPYLDGMTVGFFDGTAEDVTVHASPMEACADFLYRETEWVLHRRRVTAG